MGNREILDAMEGALDHVRDAQKYIRGVESCSDVLDVLGDIETQLAGRVSTLGAFVEAQEDAETDELVREYFAGVM